MLQLTQHIITLEYTSRMAANIYTPISPTSSILWFNGFQLLMRTLYILFLAWLTIIMFLISSHAFSLVHFARHVSVIHI